MAAEWSDYAVERKGLRVSTTPRGAQRSTYFLSLPYRYGLLLVAFSALLHWLISQSLFLVSVQAYGPARQRDPSQDLTSCGFSPVAIVASISVGAVMLSYSVGMGFRKFRSGMPVAGSNSLAMSAACHPCPLVDEYDEDREGLQVEYLPLKWGAVPLEGRRIGHCTFYSKEVETLQDEGLYQ